VRLDALQLLWLLCDHHKTTADWMTSSLTTNLRGAWEGHGLGLISIGVFIGKKIYFLDHHKTIVVRWQLQRSVYQTFLLFTPAKGTLAHSFSVSTVLYVSVYKTSMYRPKV